MPCHKKKLLRGSGRSDKFIQYCNSKKLENVWENHRHDPLPTRNISQGFLLCQHKTGCRPSCEKLQLRLRLNLFGFKLFQKQQRLFPFAPSFANKHMWNVRMTTHSRRLVPCVLVFIVKNEETWWIWMCRNCLQQLQYVCHYACISFVHHVKKRNDVIKLKTHSTTLQKTSQTSTTS